MRVLLAASCEKNLNAGVAGATMLLGSAMEKQGVEVRYLFENDLSGRSATRRSLVTFPLRLAAARSKWNDVDIVDIPAPDAAMLVQLRRRPAVVTRSHGLEQAVDRVHRDGLSREGRTASWKYRMYRGGIRLWTERSSLRKADFSIFLNQFEVNLAVKELGLPPERVRMVGHGISELFLEDGGEPVARDPAALMTIAQIGTWIQRKGIAYGSPALNAILQQCPDVSLLLIGTGCPDEEVLAGFDPIFHNRIRVVAYYDRATLPQLLRSCQIVVMPTLAEGYGLSLVEAMACGLAPVATRVPGPEDIVDDGVTGLLVPSRDSLAIQRAILRLKEDRPLLQRLRNAARAKARTLTWERSARETISCYEACLALRSSGARQSNHARPSAAKNTDRATVDASSAN